MSGRYSERWGLLVCDDCEGLAIADLEEHERWHEQRAAAADRRQGDLFGPGPAGPFDPETGGFPPLPGEDWVFVHRRRPIDTLPSL